MLYILYVNLNYSKKLHFYHFFIEPYIYNPIYIIFIFYIKQIDAQDVPASPPPNINLFLLQNINK